MEESKTCKICEETKSIESWPKDRHRLRTCCRDCFLAKKRESGKRCRRDNIDKALEKEREYREKNRERITEKHREWTEKNREHVNAKARYDGREWRKKNLEWARERKRNYQAKNIEKTKAYQKKSYEKRRRENPAFFIVEKVKKAIRLIMKNKVRKNNTTLFYTGCETVEEFLSRMSEQTSNKNWMTDNYEIDHIMQRHWFRDFLSKNPSLNEEIAEIMSHYSNLRPLSRDDNRERSWFDVSFVTEEIFDKFSQFWNEDIVKCSKFYLESKHLFSGERIVKLSKEEDILLNFLNSANQSTFDD